MAESVTVHVSGPLFEAAKDNAKVRTAIGKGLLQVGLQGQRLVQTPMVQGHGVKGGNARRSVGAFLVPGHWDQVTVRSNAPGEQEVIYMSWLEEGPHGKQPKGRFQGYGFFANAGQQLGSVNMDEIMGAAIAKVLS
jgi:hypothetical protein